jgi:hypothetical protein
MAVLERRLRLGSKVNHQLVQGLGAQHRVKLVLLEEVVQGALLFKHKVSGPFLSRIFSFLLHYFGMARIWKKLSMAMQGIDCTVNEDTTQSRLDDFTSTTIMPSLSILSQSE